MEHGWDCENGSMTCTTGWLFETVRRLVQIFMTSWGVDVQQKDMQQPFRAVFPLTSMEDLFTVVQPGFLY